MTYTVITPTRVLQVRARSYVHLTTALHEVGIKWLAIHEVQEGAE